jgi:hypothetical protein
MVDQTHGMGLKSFIAEVMFAAARTCLKLGREWLKTNARVEENGGK